MSRVIAAMACGFTLAACSMSLPSFDMFKSGAAMETLQIESEPPGADARTSQGQTCRTPCELTVTSGTDMEVTVAMTGFQPQTLPVHPETVEGSGAFASSTTKLQPNPVYVELQAITPAKPAKKPPARKRTTAAAKLPAAADTSSTQASTPASSSYPTPTQGYPWPTAPQ
jgi:PEGA domain